MFGNERNRCSFPAEYARIQGKDCADTINTGISVAAVFVPHVLAVQVTWAIQVEIYSLIFGRDFAYNVAQSPGSAFVFLAQYFLTDKAPSELATDAYEGARDAIAEEIERMNAVQLT